MKTIQRALFLLLILALPFPCGVSAQPGKEADELFSRGQELFNTSRSRADMEKALEMFEKALAINKKLGRISPQGWNLNDIGLVYRSWGQYQKALDYFEQALQIHRKTGNRKEEATTLHNAAQVYNDWGQYQKALEMFEKALTINRQLGRISPQGYNLNDIGLIYRAWGDYPKALHHFDQALQLFKKNGNLRDQATVLHNEAQVYDNWGLRRKALEIFEEALAINRKLGLLQPQGYNLNDIGLIYRSWGDYPKAMDYFDQALEIHRNTGNLKEEAATLHNAAQVYDDWGQYQKALKMFQKALAINRQLGLVQPQGYNLNDIGLIYRSWGDYPKAMDYFDQALRIYSKGGNLKEEATTLHNAAQVYNDWGQYQKALEMYEKALTINRKLGHADSEGWNLNDIGLVYRSWGQYPKAMDYFNQALEIYKKTKNIKEQAVTLHNSAQTYSDWGQYHKALEIYRESLAINEKLGRPQQQGETLNDIGLVYHAWGQNAKALDYLDRALQVFQDAGNLKGEAITLNNIAGLRAQAGEYEKALEDRQRALDIQKKIGVPTKWTMDQIGNLYLDMGKTSLAEPLIKEAGYLSSLGRLAFIRADYGKAREHYEQLIAWGEKTGRVDSFFIGYTGAGMAGEALEDYEKAAEYYEKGVTLTEEIRSSLLPSERETFFSVRIGGFDRTAPYKGLVRVLMRLNRHLDALKQTEYTKARIFSEILSRRSPRIGLDVPPDVLKKDLAINDRLASLKKAKATAFEKGRQHAVKELESQIAVSESERRDHVKRLRVEYPLFAATRYPQPLDLVQTALKDDEWAVLYAVIDPGLVVFLTRGTHLIKSVYKPITRPELVKLVRTFREPLEIAPGRDDVVEKLSSFNFAAGKALYDILLGDVAVDLPAGVPVMVVPDDCLGVLPFEMLVMNDRGRVQFGGRIPVVQAAEFFGDRNPVWYCQSITALTLARVHSAHKKPGEKLLVVADPVFQMSDARAGNLKAHHIQLSSAQAELYKTLMAAMDDGSTGIVFPRLELAGKLAQEMEKMNPGACEILAGLDASKQLLFEQLQPRLGQFRDVIFVTHGYFGKDLPGIREPVLVLTLVPAGTDGFLRMSEVTGLRMSADMVVLTACQTGLGRYIFGEGTMGMGRAFQYAGAKSVLMSLWSVSEESSIKLVASFFKHLKEGKSKLDALKLARTEIRQLGYDHPFFWAPFILVGEAD